MEILRLIIKIINKVSGFISSLLKYKIVYKITGVFFTRKFKKAKCNHKYAILVAARNEETVIGNLIDSINRQDYPKELVTVFVVADNCTDNTAQIARDLGAVCYDRFDEEHRTKGYALQFLVENIRRDFGIENFEGYFIFDADNLLKQDYITRMNESFDSGQKIITSYRNTKNFGDNWISASYGIHWLRTIRNEHRARSLFHLATRIQGTGFLFSNELIKDGWNYVSLTEDRAFCADAVAQGYQISYNDAAEFYDEQPIDIKIAMRQRIRWAKGHLQAFVETGPKLLKHIFVTNGAANKNCADAPWYKRFFNNLRLRFMSLDMLSVVYPRSLITLFKRAVIYYLKFALILMGAHFTFTVFKLDIFGWQYCDGIKLNSTIAALTISAFYASFVTYFKNIFAAAYIFIVEHKRIEHIPLVKKIWYCITFPIFDIIGKFSLLIALFKKVEWKAIPHNSKVNIEDINCNRAKVKENYTTKT
ncbi:MAG: glycosyltransferase family 2 protein [Acutalibacteraceae bacterium]|nr:glycosyltransferase family 2 protein [Acutalibacteraceae bacterium]